MILALHEAQVGLTYIFPEAKDLQRLFQIFWYNMYVTKCSRHIMNPSMSCIPQHVEMYSNCLHYKKFCLWFCMSVNLCL
jgi:hypothetical protein